jgi:thioredoxin 1
MRTAFFLSVCLSTTLFTNLLDAQESSKLLSFLSRSKASETQAVRKLAAQEDLRQVIADAPGVVLIDFYADWCGPCKEQGAILATLDETAQRNRASIIKVDVDQHAEIAKLFQVESLPTLVVVKDGQLIDHKTGLASVAEVDTWLRK